MQVHVYFATNTITDSRETVETCSEEYNIINVFTHRHVLHTNNISLDLKPNARHLPARHLEACWVQCCVEN